MLNLMKRIKIEIYNRQHGTTIKSAKADLRAKYGKGVLVGTNTVVDKDVSLGKYTYVNRDSNIENCEIGNYCSISSGVWINPAEHNIHSRINYPLLKSADKKKVYIGNDVLISLNAIILTGVTIGDGGVIAAGAVVTKDVKPFEIVGGVPAKHIGWKVEEKEQNIILTSKWWNYDIDILQSNTNFFYNKTDALND